MHHRRTRAITKIILYVSGVIITTIIIAAVWVSQHYKRVIREQLPKAIARTGKNRYKSSLEDVSINILTRRVTLHGLRIWYDSLHQPRRPPVSFNIAIPVIHASGINWVALVQEQQISCRTLLLDHPDLQWVQVNDTLIDTLGSTVDSPGKKRFPAGIDFDEIHLQHMQLRYEARGETAQLLLVKDADIRLTDWDLDLETKKKDSSRILYAAALSARCNGISYRNSKDVYLYRADSFTADTRRRQITVSGLKIKSLVSRAEFYRLAGRQKDFFNVAFGSINFLGVDLRDFLNRKRVTADSMLLDRGAVDVYFSRIPDPDPRSKLGRFPNQLLLKLPLTVDVAYASVQRGHASYTEVNEETELPGALKFDGLNGSIRNITNDSARIRKNAHCVLDLKGIFNGGAAIRGTFDFLLSDTNGVFTLDGYLKDVGADHVSAAAKALAKTEVSSIHVQQLDIKVWGDQYQAKGNFRLLYTDLSLTVQKLDERGGKMRDRPLLSFLANKILLYPANPMPGEATRTATTAIRRQPNRSFFNLIWSNIYEGIKATAIRNTELAKAINQKKKGVRSKTRTSEGKGSAKDK
jgi:hypothetical protein